MGLCLGFIALLVTVPGLMHGWAFARRSMGKVRAFLAGGLEISVLEGPVFAGPCERVEMVLGLRARRAHPIGKVSWQLHHIEEAARDVRGTRRDTPTVSRVWDAGLYRHGHGTIEAPSAVADTRIAIVATIPAEGPATLYTDTRRMRWQLRASVETPYSPIQVDHELLVVPFRAA